MNVTRYCVGVGKTAADYPGTIPAGATTYVGCLAARTDMHAGNWDGDTLMLVGTFGAADRAEFPSNAAAGTALSSNPMTCGGIHFGTDPRTGSKVNGVTFDMTNVTSFDMRGGTAPLGRAGQAIGALGDRVLFILGENTRIYPPDYKYITGAVAAGSQSYAEDFSPENIGISIRGQGRVIGPNVPKSKGYQIDGTGGWCKFGVEIRLWHDPAAATNYLSGVDGVNIQGASLQVDIGYYGSSYSRNGLNVPNQGQQARIMSCRFGRTSWGGVDQSILHGGDSSIAGNLGGVYYLFNLHEHDALVQDATQIICPGAYVGYNTWKDVRGGEGRPASFWKNMGAGQPWALVSESFPDAKGNALKIGLSVYDNALAGAPTSWLGGGGTVGASLFQVPELNTVVHANTIDGCGAIGITANASGGFALLYNRVRRTRGHSAVMTLGNNFIVGNYLAVTDTNPTAGVSALAVSASTRLYSFNNVMYAPAAGSTDMHIFPNGLAGGANAGNVYGTGKKSIEAVVQYNVANDILGGAVADISAWDWDRGWPAGHWLRGAGSRDFLKTLRTCYGDIDISSNRVGPTVTPGPYAG